MLPNDADLIASRRPAFFWAVPLLAITLVCLGCQSTEPASTDAATGDDPAMAPHFLERGAELGIDFTQDPGMGGSFYFPEIMGGGVALLDYDLDGDLDLYLVQGGELGPNAKRRESDRLYRNNWVPDGLLRFVDVTDEANISATEYGMGVSVGDANGDGWPDLYLSSFGTNQLWINRTDGSFEERALALGVDDAGWGAGAAFIDLDRDGDQDLVAINYVDFRFTTHKECFNTRSAIDYCSPKSYPSAHNRLWENVGQGRYEDRSEQIQLRGEAGASLGLVADDFNGDGQLDLYVANDGAPNRLWVQQGELRFTEGALLAGCAVNRSGEAEASMGIDAADFDEDGDPDLFMTHLTDETNTLYLNDGRGWFDDATQRFKLGSNSRAWTGFGTAWRDLDLDGWLDLIVANGAVFTLEEQQEAGDALPFRQPNQLFLSEQAQSFQAVDLDSGRGPGVSRGLATGDIDNDGDLDLIIQNLGERPSVWINQLNPGQRWLGLQLPLGSQVEWNDGEIRRRRTIRAHGSYASSSDPRLLIPVDPAVGSPKLFVTLPGGRTARLEQLEAGRYHTPHVEGRP